MLTDMEKKLSWDEIERRYPQHWVQLVDYDWPEGNPTPISGVVRVYAPTRKEFNQLVLMQERPRDAARIFVGQPKLDDHTVISCNSVRITRCE